MRISHVCPFVGEQAGGSERYVFNLARSQADEHDIHIYTTTSHLDRVGVSLSNNITFHRYYSPLIIWNINPICIMLQDLVKSKSDIFHIHSYLYTSSNQAALASKLRKSKTLLHLHGGVGFPPYRTSMARFVAKTVYDKTLGKFTIESSDVIASVSNNDLALMTRNYKLPPEKLRYIPNVVDTDIFQPTNCRSERHEDIVTYVGDFEPWKGITLLIEWIRQTNNWNGSNVNFRFIGQGSLQPKLEALQKQLEQRGTESRVEVLGPRQHEEIPSFLQESSALILPSFWEGLPTVLLEAMASGVPVISTKVGDVPHLITHMKTGFLIDRTMRSFRNAINMVLGESDFVKGIAVKARKLVERNFNLKNIGRIIREVYLELSS